MSKYSVAVDLGATKILVGLVANERDILARKRMFTCIDKGPEHAIASIQSTVAALLEEYSIPREHCRLGMCVPGPVDIVKGEMVNSVNMKWGVVPMRGMLEDATALPVVLDHDAKVSACGEFHYGVGAGKKNMVYIVVGSGVGGAIIIDGKIYRGIHNYAGEFGLMTIDYDGDSGLTRIPGNAQSFMAGPSLCYRYKQLLEHEGLPPPPDGIDAKYIGELAYEKNPQALRVIQNAGNALGVLVASLAMILDIDFYVVGSSLAKLGDVFLEPARHIVSRYAFVDVAKHVKIVQSALEDDAALLGCARMAQRGL